MKRIVIFDLKKYPRFKQLDHPYPCFNCGNFERCLNLWKEKNTNLCYMKLEREKLEKVNAGG